MSEIHRKQGVYTMEINEDLLNAAKELAAEAETEKKSLPQQIGGFPDMFVAGPEDRTIATMYAFVSDTGNSYKIGTKK